MATDENQCDDHQEWQCQDDTQADGVEEALFVLVQDGVPDGTQEGADFLHGARLERFQRNLS